MVATGEVEIMRVHESGRTLKFWLKMIFTLGLYAIAWRSRSWILTDRRLIRHTGVINIEERSILDAIRCSCRASPPRTTWTGWPSSRSSSRWPRSREAR